MTRPCPGCGTTDLANFSVLYDKRKGREYRRTRCRLCDLKRNNETQRLSRQRQARSRKSHLEKYGLTAGQYEMILKSQNEICPICNLPLTTDICIDHDHQTGRVRGLLHRWCNTGLGQFKDNIESLKRAILYLQN